MRKLLLIAGVAALMVPSIASAQPGCEAQRHDNRVAGAIFGAGAGAVFGGIVSGRGSGAALGAFGGAVAGNVAGGSSVHCNDDGSTGFYDSNGVWHDAGGYYDDGRRLHAASGYYDGDGRWVEGAHPAPPAAGDYGADVAYVGGPRDVPGHEGWIETRIRRGEDAGAISRYDADTARSRLTGIRDLEGRLRDDHDGLTDADRAGLNARLDDLNAAVSAQWRPAD